jgi:hypothetical protein
MRQVGFVSVICAMLLAAPRAAAQDGGEPISLRYRAPSTCPDQDAFLARLRERAPLARPASSAERARVVEITIEAGAPGSRGTLRITDLDGRHAAREVTAVDCADVVQALALIAAIALDPKAGAKAAPDAPASRPPSPGVAGVAPGPPPPARHRGDEDATMPAPPPGTPVRISVGPQLAAVWAAAPQALAGIRLFGEVAAPGDGVLRPSARVSVMRTLATADGASPTAARFQLTTARMDGCLVGWPGLVRVSPCALFEAGVLDATGEQVRDRRTFSAPWLTLGALLRVQTVVGDILVLELEGGVDARLTSYRFYLEPDATLYELPRVGATLAAGVGLRFP